MAETQHAGAARLLEIIREVGPRSGTLTFKGAAKLMGRPNYENDARAVAQMGDLMDAAACLAGVPALALVAVTSDSGEVNPKAWKKEFGAGRDAIIALP